MTTYYVDGAVGSDANSGTATGAGNAWATVQKAANTAVAGDKVYIKASAAYPEQVACATNAGTEDAPIVFEGYATTPGDGGRATIEGGNTRAYSLTTDNKGFLVFRNLLFQGMTSRPLEWTNTTNNWRFENCRFTAGSATPVGFCASSAFASLNGLILLGCEIDGFSGSDGNPLTRHTTSNLSVIGCSIHDNGNSVAINTGAFGGGLVVQRCRIWANAGDGIQVATNYSFVHITHNTIHGNGGHGIRFTGSGYAPAVVADNLIDGQTGTGKAGISADTALAGLLIDGNAFWNNTANYAGVATGPRDVILSAAPGYTDAANGDFTPSNPDLQSEWP